MKEKVINGLSILVIFLSYLSFNIRYLVDFHIDLQLILRTCSLLMIVFFLSNSTINQLKLLLIFIISIGLIYIESGLGEYTTGVAVLVSVPVLALAYIYKKQFQSTNEN